MNVLVTGGAGYIGSHTAKALARAHHVPIVYDNLSCGHRWAVRWGPFEEGDLRDKERLREVIRRYEVEAVIHFAAFIAVGESVAKPGLYFRNNVANTLNLLEILEEAGVGPIVFSSTAAVYGMPETEALGEEHRHRPVNPYGETKLVVERMLHWYSAAGKLRYVALRYFNAAGADPEGELGEEHEPETHLIPRVIGAAQGRYRALDLFGTDYPTPDGTAIRDYIHVADLADAHVRALGYLAEGGGSGAFNLGTGRGHTVREVIRAVEHVAGKPVPVVERGRRAGDATVLVADPRRALATFGWQPRHSSLETIVETAWRWHSRPA